MDHVRVDKWLWAVRLYKTRAEATAACRKSAVQINGATAKPASSVRVDDCVTARLREMTKTYRVLALIDRRVGASRLPDLIKDETPEEEIQRAKERRENARLSPYQGAGRPTKKNRRDLETYFGRGG
ncbi:MAG: RNA-binding S4 domain-containing protein [Verrucomicrobiota bacterium]